MAARQGGGETGAVSMQPPPIPASPHGGVDASVLPQDTFGTKSLAFWGTIGFMVIEAATIALCLATYIYLRRNFDAYPPPGIASPGLVVPTINLVLMLLSLPLARAAYRAAKAFDKPGILRTTGLLLVVGVAILVLRAFELDALNVRWDSNAYGSAVWFTVGFHTLLLILDFAESLAIFLIFARAKEEEKHYGDVADDVLYWAFVVFLWVPVYLAVIIAPHFVL